MPVRKLRAMVTPVVTATAKRQASRGQSLAKVSYTIRAYPNSRRRGNMEQQLSKLTSRRTWAHHLEPACRC